jgi:hypothetical protein
MVQTRATTGGRLERVRRISVHQVDFPEIFRLPGYAVKDNGVAERIFARAQRCVLHGSLI